MYIAICADADCAGDTTNPVSGIYSAFYSPVAIGFDGFPLVALSVPIDRFALSRCLDGACSSERTNVNPTASCDTAALVVGSDGRPAAACVSGVGDFVRLFRCLDDECYARPAILEIDIRHPVWGGYAGQDPSVCIGSDGRVAGFFSCGKGEYEFALAPLGF